MGCWVISRSINCRHVITMAVCMVECLLLGGTLFGWYNLVYIFKIDRIYSDLCITADTNASALCNVPSTNNIGSACDPQKQNTSLLSEDLKANSTFGYAQKSEVDSMEEASSQTPKCLQQEEYLSLAFTVGLVFFGIGAFAAGFLFDKRGLLATRLLGSMLAVCAYLMLAFVNKDIPWLIFPGCACLAVSCCVIILTNSHIAWMAGHLTPLVIAVYSGGVNSAGAVFWLIKLIHGRGVPRMYSMLTMVGIVGISICNTVFLVPHYKVKAPVYKVANNTDVVNSTRTTEEPTKNSVNGTDEGNGQLEVAEQEDVKRGGLKQCLFSWLNVVYLVWFASLHVCVQFFLGSFNSRVTRIVDGDTAKVSHFTDVLAYTQLCSLTIGLLTGIVMVMSRSHVLKKGLTGQNRALAEVTAVLMACGASLVLVVTCSINTEHAMYAAIVASEFVRSTLYASACALLEISWPAEHFGVLFGFAQLVVGVGALMQQPYIIWALARGFRVVDMWLLVTCLLSLSLPFFIMARYCCSNRRN